MGVPYSILKHKTDTYLKILNDLGYKGTSGNCHLDPDLRENIRRNIIAGWKPAFGQMDIPQRYLSKSCVEKDDILPFFGWFRRVEVRDGKYRYVSNLNFAVVKLTMDLENSTLFDK